ncbi:hypothetical protein RT95_12520 [Xanthomonas campestris]|nr:hypothetical protein RT95_12520 [Xanthomonas campestris]
METSTMNHLEQEMTLLRRLFEPWNTVPHGTVIWEPEASDPNGAFKREMIGKAGEVIAAGDSALAGASFNVPQFGEPDFDSLEASLANDHEQGAFYELAVACDRVVQSLARVAA